MRVSCSSLRGMFADMFFVRRRASPRLNSLASTREQGHLIC